MPAGVNWIRGETAPAFNELRRPDAKGRREVRGGRLAEMLVWPRTFRVEIPGWSRCLNVVVQIC
jgi:hypothetical protein